MPDSTATLPREAADYLAAHPETSGLDAFFADLSGVVRGKRYPMDLFDKILTEGAAMPGSVCLLDTMGESHDPDGIGFSDGDPDHLVKPLPGTLQPVPWAAHPLAQVMLTFQNGDGSPYAYEPRNVLARVLERFKELALTPVVAFELEFYLIDTARLKGGLPQPPKSPFTGARDNDTQVYGMSSLENFAEVLEGIASAARTQGVRTSAITAEYAPGQFEINLHHGNDPLQLADQCVMFKRAVKGVARNHGMQATFMAKPYLDSSGSGLHMHASLLDSNGRNVFDGGAEPSSETLRHAIGGILDQLPEAMALLAPNVNSFRRYLPDIYVPVQRSWGYENRSVALRIPHGAGAARRIEHRVPGADANPYLAMASLLAGIHHGITNKIDPGKPWEGNAGDRYDPDLPFRPRRAVERLQEGDQLASYLGADYIRAYGACKTAELDKFENQISPAEYAWYLQGD